MFKKCTKLIRYLLRFRVIRFISNGIFTFIEKISGYQIEKFFFEKYTGYKSNIKSPRSLNEKIVYKKIHDRDPLLTLTADKYRVREYVKEKLGDETANQILIPLLYVTDDPDTIPFDELPEEYIIKANHGSGTNIIVQDNSKIDRQKIVKKCKLWLDWPYGLFKHEWAYQDIERKIVIEKLIYDKKGNLPEDYKLHVINGDVQFIQADYGRHDEGGIRRSVYNQDWEKLDVKIKYMNEGIRVPKPEKLQKMKELAIKLAAPFEHVRVDLYEVAGRIYFGELTHYPGSGRAKIDPVSFDFELGKRYH